MEIWILLVAYRGQKICLHYFCNLYLFFVYILLHSINSFLKFDLYMPIMIPWLKNKIIVYLFMEPLHSDRIVVLHLTLSIFNHPLGPLKFMSTFSRVDVLNITLCYLTTRAPSVSIHSRYIYFPSDKLPFQIT